MLNWLRRSRQRRDLCVAEADQLIADYGVQAYGTARALMRYARSRGDRVAAVHFAKTAVEIARRTGRKIGLDTATRYQQEP